MNTTLALLRLMLLAMLVRVQSVTLSINNLDDAAPTVTSGSDAGSVVENGLAQVVYTATADDSNDISGGVTFSLMIVTLRLVLMLLLVK